ncbi:MAG: DMT family transporter [Gemmatimonadota bacterium]
MQSLWMLVSCLLFAVMGVCVKFAAQQYGVMELVFYRGVIGCCGIALFVRMQGGSLATSVPWLHLRRGAVGTMSLALWLYATTVLPLGTAMTLNYSSPLFLAAFSVAAALMARRPVNWPMAAVVVVGFIGVLLVLQPSFDDAQSNGALAGLASGVMAALAFWHVKELARLGEPEWRIVFYFSASGVGLGLIGALTTGFSPHTLRGVALLLAVGLTATLAQLAMTRAYGRGRTLLAANLQFSAIVFAALLGLLVFDDRITPPGWLGIVLIIGGGMVATIVSARRARPGQRVEEIIEPDVEK